VKGNGESFKSSLSESLPPIRSVVDLSTPLKKDTFSKVIEPPDTSTAWASAIESARRTNSSADGMRATEHGYARPARRTAAVARTAVRRVTASSQAKTLPVSVPCACARPPSGRPAAVQSDLARTSRTNPFHHGVVDGRSPRVQHRVRIVVRRETSDGRMVNFEGAEGVVWSHLADAHGHHGESNAHPLGRAFVRLPSVTPGQCWNSSACGARLNGHLMPIPVTVEQLVQRIAARREQPSVTVLVAIDGRGGSGKSTIAAAVAAALPSARVVHLDDFASPQVDRMRLLEQVIVPLKANRAARYQRYDWNAKALADWFDIPTGGVVIIEGVSTLHDVLYEHVDVRVWVDCSAQVGFERGLARDRTVYGVDTHDQWVHEWMPAEQTYVDAQHPQDRADYIIENGAASSASAAKAADDTPD
jgi:uridine kinase